MTIYEETKAFIEEETGGKKRTKKYMDAKIRKYIDYCRSLLPEVTDEELASEDGDIIFYMNGNDSTSFDWNVNDMLCEFYLFYKDSGMGFVKAIVNKNDTINGYVYKNKEYRPIETHPERMNLAKGDAESIFRMMMRYAEKKDLCNKTLKRIFEL